MSMGGKSSSGSQPSSGGYQPTQAAQQQFQSGMPQQQPGVAQQLNQISGDPSPAVSTMVNQQMAPQGATGMAPVMGMSSQSAPAPTMMDQYATAMGGSAGMNPQQMYNQYSNAIFGGQPGQAYTPNFNGASTPISADITPEAASYGQPIGLPNGQQLDLNPQQQQIAAQTSFFSDTLPGQIGSKGGSLAGGSYYTDAQGNHYSGGEMIQTGRPGNEDVFGNMPGSPGYAPGIQMGFGPEEGRGFGPNPGDINPDTGQINPQPDARPPAPIAQPAPAPVAQPAPIAQPAPVARPVAQPVAKPAPAPMPTRATQGYVSRVPVRPTSPVPVKAAPKPVAKPAPVAKPVVQPVAKPAPKPVVKAAVKAPVKIIKR
jgi:hypothetical protein